MKSQLALVFAQIDIGYLLNKWNIILFSTLEREQENKSSGRDEEKTMIAVGDRKKMIEFSLTVINVLFYRYDGKPVREKKWKGSRKNFDRRRQDRGADK